MISESLFSIHPFWIEKHNLGGIYDQTSNVVINISRKEYDLIVKGISDPNNLSDELCKLLSEYAELNLLKPIRDFKIRNSDVFAKNVSDYSELRAIPRKLTLELTENCNLRCKYCRYTINEIKKEGRYHNQTVLSYDKAVKAIDNYFENYSKILANIPEQLISQYIKRNPAVIGYYGGEPLLEKQTLKDLINYSANKAVNLNIPSLQQFVTTNGTLLSSDIVKYFVDNKVYLSISLDGPQCENDKNRVYKNGKGSFAKVYEVLKFIRDKFPEYFKTSITIQAVAAPNYQIDNVNEFFYNMSDNNLYAGVNSFVRLDFADFSGEDKLNNLNIIDDNYINAILDNTISICEKISKNATYEEVIRVFLFSPEYMDIFRMAFTSEARIGDRPNCGKEHFNSCYLGKANIVLRANGEYHFCERTDYSMPIGHIDNGFDRDKIRGLYKEYFDIMNRHECIKCWASIFCPICIGQLVDNSQIKCPTDAECKQIRGRYDLYLKLLLVLAHKFPLIYTSLQTYFTKSNDTTIDDFMKLHSN